MDLNTTLIVLGVAALVILVIHGIWSSRREESRYFKSAETFTKDSRLQNRNRASDETLSTETSFSSQTVMPMVDDRQQSLSFETDGADVPPHSDDIQQIKIHLSHSQTQVEQPTLSSMSTLDELEQFRDQEYGIDTHSAQLREQLADLGRNNLDMTAQEKTVENTKAQYLMLYVVAAEGAFFHGAKLAKILDDLGFLFGEKQIYHRHSDLNINSPILFSVANIEAPGTFDYNMQDFATVGIALFIQFPSEGSDLMNLRMMILAAKSIAEELEGFVLTPEQKPFDEQEEKRYLDLVR